MNQMTAAPEKPRPAVTDWLLSAARDPRNALQEWETGGMTILRCGTLFCVIRLSVVLVETVSHCTSPAKVDAFLAEALYGGPVIRCNTGRSFYALVQPSAAECWQVRDTECLSSDYDLGVPRPDLTEYPGFTASYWAVPMAEPAALCSAEAVSQLAAYGRHQQAMEGTP